MFLYLDSYTYITVTKFRFLHIYKHRKKCKASMNVSQKFTYTSLTSSPTEYGLSVFSQTISWSEIKTTAFHWFKSSTNVGYVKELLLVWNSCLRCSTKSYNYKAKWAKSHNLPSFMQFYSRYIISIAIVTIIKLNISNLWWNSSKEIERIFIKMVCSVVASQVFWQNLNY